MAGRDGTPASRPELVDRRPVVVTALALPPAARQALASAIGDVRVVDVRESVETADVVIAPSCSPQTIARLREAFPTARLVIAELEDDETGVEFAGPVTRLLRAGADAYVTADSLADLADLLTARRTVTSAASPELTVTAHEPASTELAPGAVDDLVLQTLDAVLAERALVERGRAERARAESSAEEGTAETDRPGRHP